LTSEPQPGRAGVEPALPVEGTYELAAHRCFACGDLNVRGIRMPLHMEPDRAWSDLTLDPTFQGWEGIAHGGIVATLLDEAMAWATASREMFGFTARMTIEYRRPVPVGVPIRVEGRIVDAKRRIIRTEGSIVDRATDIVLAHADGVYVAAPEERAREMRARYRFRGAVNGAGATQRWRVVQSLPAVEPAGSAPGPTAPEASIAATPGTGMPIETGTPDPVAVRVTR
jgi:uncharacterized protein (TIGR00369 family)